MKVLSVADRFDSVPEEQVITISRVKDASCLYRYFKNYVDRPKDEAAFVSIETAVGSFFHSCAEDWFKAIAARRRRHRRRRPDGCRRPGSQVPTVVPVAGMLARAVPDCAPRRRV
ncbi:MAG: hypothetical protein OXU40_09470 [Nitrospira sp.]|nr:hypothetical protein [Nitrospira sp.]